MADGEANSDAKISKDALQAHFQLIIDEALALLAHLEFQLGKSHDFNGDSHKAYVAKVATHLRACLKAAEKMIYETAS